MDIKQLKEMLEILACIDSVGGRVETAHPYTIGGNYFIRTVTHYFTGRLVAVYEQELVLEDVAWIADTGRYANALATGVFKEVEPYPQGSVVIGRGALIDAKLIEFVLPQEQK